jgi:hypothetical protein
MKYKKYKLLSALLLVAIFITTISLVILWKYIFFTSIKYHEPLLLFVAQTSSGKSMVEAEPNLITGQKYLVVATHGWIEEKGWPQDLVLDIYDKVDGDKWLCGWFDWRPQSRTINPTNTTKYAKETAGPMLAGKILALSPNFEHIHLIGHSSGSWAINEAARILAKKTKATIHLTFLDAYVPPFWRQSELADIVKDPNDTYWAEQYFTRDLIFSFTQPHLTNAVNIDLTDINPGFKGHKFPWHWYIGTVTGSYMSDPRYKASMLYYRANNIDYGFPRSLEAGEQNWQTSLKLKPNPEPVKIKPE